MLFQSLNIKRSFFMSERYKLLIDGQLVDGKTTDSVINPATEELVAQCPAASSEQLDQAIKAAKRAFPAWRDTPLKERQAMIAKAAKVIADSADELASILSQEQGKPVAKAKDEVLFSVSVLEHASKMDIPVTVLEDTAEQRVEVRQAPVGVIAAITPWNYPIDLASKKMAVPMVAGNTIVLKPSPNTPLSTLKIAELVSDIFPAGVFNVVAGDESLGPQLTAHPLIDKISFTGSVNVGKIIASVAAKTLTPVTLELGGNDAAIVLPDVDLDDVAKRIFWGAFTNTGQVCIAIKRLYAHKDIIEPLTERLVKLAQSVKVGRGDAPDTELGPMNNEMQLKLVDELVQDAKKSGAKVLTGGERIPGAGYFYSPTIVTNIKEGVRLVDEEQFGPALPIIEFTDIDDVVERANNSAVGLGGSVWTKDHAKGVELGKRIQSGMIWVNGNFYMNKEAPFGGMKLSGVGREGGIYGVMACTEPQAVTLFK
jgi:aldehyde dehydrogenase (NAD+)